MMTTEELMRRYREERSEEAFGELARRYVDLVYSTALRRLNGDAHLAEDVAQSVFTDFALKLRAGASIQMPGGWLHKHACYVSAKVIRAESRRRLREKEALDMIANEPDWKEIAPHLDEALEELSSEDRHAIVLRYFEKRDFRAVGAELGLSDDAAQKRVARAVGKLREQLARRGVTVSAAALAVGLGAKAVEAAPATLAGQVTATAFSAASALGGATLIFHTIMVSMKLKIAVGGAIALALAATPVIVKNISRNAEPAQTVAAVSDITQTSRTEAAIPVADPQPVAAASITKTPITNAAQNTLHLTVLDAENDQPIRSVQVFTRSGKQPFDSTDREGSVNIPFTPQKAWQEWYLRKEPYADTSLRWHTNEVIPSQYTVKLVHGVKISGTVVGPDNEPVDGSSVGFNHEDAPETRTRPDSHEFARVETQTDALGHWEIRSIAADMIQRLRGGARHPEYTEARVRASQDAAVAKQLLDGTHVFHLGRAGSIRGIVVNEQDQPVAGASVLCGHLSETGGRQTTAGADGRFVLVGCRTNETLLTAESKGYAAKTININLAENPGPFKLVLNPGKTLKIRVVNKEGSPIAGASVWMNCINPPFQGTIPPISQVEFKAKTDSDGRLSWENAPDQEMPFSISATGYMQTGNVELRPDGREHIVTMNPALVISGTVVDDASSEPIPKFKLVLGWVSHPTTLTTQSPLVFKSASQTPILSSGRGPELQSTLNWSPTDQLNMQSVNGAFRHTLEEPVCLGISNCVFKIEADGFSTYTSREIALDEGEAQFAVELKKTSLLELRVLTPEGKPAAGAKLALVASGVQFSLNPGGFQSASSSGNFLSADANGSVKLTFSEDLQRVVAACPEGYADIPVADLPANTNIVLQAWGRIEGTYKSLIPDADPCELTLSFPANAGSELVLNAMNYKVTLNSSGNFAWPKVPPVKVQIIRMVRHQITGNADIAGWMHQPTSVFVDVQPGETSTVALPGFYAVSARLLLPAGYDKSNRIFLDIHAPPPAISANRANAALRPQGAQLIARVAEPQYQMRQAPDGLWVAEGVPGGSDYILEGRILEMPSLPTNVAHIKTSNGSIIMSPTDAAAMGAPKRLFETKRPFSLPAEPATGSVDLGEIELTPVQ